MTFSNMPIDKTWPLSGLMRNSHRFHHSSSVVMSDWSVNASSLVACIYSSLNLRDPCPSRPRVMAIYSILSLISFRCAPKMASGSF